MLDRVVAAAHVVTQEATSYGTGVPVIGGIKNSFRISLFLSKKHRDIVVKAQRGYVEKHLHLRAQLEFHSEPQVSVAIIRLL
jgi:hypothetical protein